MRTPEAFEGFDLPDKVIVEPKSRFAVNIPVELQNYERWWEDPVNAGTIRRIRELRVANNVILMDALGACEPDGHRPESALGSRVPQPGDYIAARVDGWDITQAEIDNYDLDGPDPETLMAHRDMPEPGSTTPVR